MNYPQQNIQTQLRTVGFGRGGGGGGGGGGRYGGTYLVVLLVVAGVVVGIVVLGVVVEVDWACKSLWLQVRCPALTTSVRSKPFPSHLQR